MLLDTELTQTNADNPNIPNTEEVSGTDLGVKTKPIGSFSPSNCQAELSSPNERHYFGGYKNVTSVWGASAPIDTQDLDICAGTPIAGTNLSALWVGIDNGDRSYLGDPASAWETWDTRYP